MDWRERWLDHRASRIDDDPRRHEPVRCSECGAATKYGKPYCLLHIDQMPYVQQMLRDASTDDEQDQEQQQQRPASARAGRRRRRAEITPKQLAVLRAAADGPLDTASALAASGCSAVGSVYPLLTRLMTAGWLSVERVPGRASKVWSITPAGREKLASIGSDQIPPADQQIPPADPIPDPVLSPPADQQIPPADPTTDRTHDPVLSAPDPVLSTPADLTGGSSITVTGGSSITIERVVTPDTPAAHRPRRLSIWLPIIGTIDIDITRRQAQ